MVVKIEPPVSVTEFAWPSVQDIGPLFTMTCRNHTDLRWSTKHIAHRSLHYLGLDYDVEITKENATFVWRECPCPFTDLMVIEKED